MANLDWHDLEKEEGIPFIKRANHYLSPFPFAEETTIVRKTLLPFYPNLVFCELTEFATIPPISKYVLLGKDDENVGYAIDYSNDLLLQVNKENDFNINENNVADYLKFYLGFVRGPHGFFVPVEKIEDINFVIPTDQKLKKQIREKIVPFVINEDKESFKIFFNVVFKDALFKATADISLKGEVVIHSPEMLIDEISTQENILK